MMMAGDLQLSCSTSRIVPYWAQGTREDQKVPLKERTKSFEFPFIFELMMSEVELHGVGESGEGKILPGSRNPNMVRMCGNSIFTRNISLTAKEIRQAVYSVEAEARGK